MILYDYNMILYETIWLLYDTIWLLYDTTWLLYDNIWYNMIAIWYYAILYNYYMILYYYYMIIYDTIWLLFLSNSTNVLLLFIVHMHRGNVQVVKTHGFLFLKRLNFPCHVSLDKTLILNLSYNQSGIWHLLSLNVIPLDRGN